MKKVRQTSDARQSVSKKANPNITPATTKNKQAAASQAKGLWNKNPERKAKTADVLEAVNSIRNGSWQNHK